MTPSHLAEQSNYNYQISPIHSRHRYFSTTKRIGRRTVFSVYRVIAGALAGLDELSEGSMAGLDVVASRFGRSLYFVCEASLAYA